MPYKRFYTVGTKVFANKADALAFSAKFRSEVYERIIPLETGKLIVPENVKPGNKSHLDALSRFFGI